LFILEVQYADLKLCEAQEAIFIGVHLFHHSNGFWAGHLAWTTVLCGVVLCVVWWMGV
jgi:hypothetical protein